MSVRAALLVAMAWSIGCGSTPNQTAGPEGGVGASGGTKSDASSGGMSGTGGSIDASAGGSSEAALGCDAGYHPLGATCEPDETCTAKDCGTCGACVVNAGIAECQCPTGYVSSSGKCMLDPNPCDTTTCETGTACVPEAHCQPLGVCVQICDCSNCGNCGPDNSDGKWNDQQEYCGNPNSSPATIQCNTPCPPGQGCLPYSPAICWPIEGCFSL